MLDYRVLVLFPMCSAFFLHLQLKFKLHVLRLETLLLEIEFALATLYL